MSGLELLILTHTRLSNQIPRLRLLCPTGCRDLDHAPRLVDNPALQPEGYAEGSPSRGKR